MIKQDTIGKNTQQYPSIQQIKQVQQKNRLESQEGQNLIQITRNIIRSMNKQQRKEKARMHLFDALQYRSPRLDTYDQNTSCAFRVIYLVQTSFLWSFFLFILSYLFMYMVILDNEDNFIVKLALEWIMLVVLWIDVAFEIYHKSYEKLRTTSKFQKRFYVRIVVLCLLVVDQIFFSVLFTGARPIRPFLILRALLPIFYDAFVRKSFEALIWSYKDIVVYLFFYGVVIFSFALLIFQITKIPQSVPFDSYRQDYHNYFKTIYILYVMSSYDSYPDNQLIVVRESEWYYLIFITFVILNTFFFVVIPATLIFNSFRDTRSKILLIDQIKQQHSLILCFVCLGESSHLSIKINDLIEFLLYVYKNKVRYIDYITQVCLKLNDNNTQTIHVNQFMQIAKVLQSNTAMMPPMFADFQPWIQFRQWLINVFNIQNVVKSSIFKIIEVLVIIACFINGILILILDAEVCHILDSIFVGLYVIFLIITILGMGIQNFFIRNWQQVDALLVIAALIIQTQSRAEIGFHAEVLIKMARIYKIYVFAQIFGLKQNGIYRRISQLFIQTAIILPIIAKFFPMITIVYYILGIIGMEAFYTDIQMDRFRNAYSMYEQFSNFKYFIGTQYIMIQILVQAGWSMIGFDYSQIFGYYGLVMLYFVSCHVITVLILSSLMKGLVLEVYSSINEEYKNRRNIFEVRKKQEQQLQKKIKQIQSIKRQFQNDINVNRLSLVPDTVLKKQLYENKIDLEVLSKLRKVYKQRFPNKMANRSQFKTHTILDQKILLSQIKINTQDDSIMKIYPKDRQDSQINRKMPNQFEDQMNLLIGSMIVRPNTIFSEVILYPKQFVTYLQNKLKKPMEGNKFSKVFQEEEFNLQGHQIQNNNKSLNLLTSLLNSILEIEKSKKQQKIQIIAKMVKKNYITEQQGRQLLLQDNQYDASQSIDINWVVRDTFLGCTNEDLIKKFEIQYFSDIYGRQFRQINKVTLEPLLRYQATLTYCFRNLLRYPNIDQLQFFTILSTLQDKFSNRLLKRGSLFKFVFQIDTISDTWFSIELKQNKKTIIHFIKSGIWVYTLNTQPDTIYFGDDIFNWQDVKNEKGHKVCEGYMKRLYQSFQSLAFCLLDQKKFFSGNPNGFVYDLFFWFMDVRKVQRKGDQSNNLRISKIMLVILSKQEERQKPLPYQLSQLSKQEFENGNSHRKNLDSFRYDQSQNQTFQKLKKLSIMDEQRILETEGLPYSFILNLITDIQMTMSCQRYQMNLVSQVQKLLNEQFLDQKTSQRARNLQDLLLQAAINAQDHQQRYSQ